MHEQDEIDILNMLMEHLERDSGGNFFLREYNLDELVGDIYRFSTGKK